MLKKRIYNIFILFLLAGILLLVTGQIIFIGVFNEGKPLHYSWTPTGRIIRVGNSEKYIYKSKIDQKNIKLDNGEYVPYIWEPDQNKVSFADSSLVFRGSEVDFYYKDKKVNTTSFKVENKNNGEWKQIGNHPSVVYVETIKTEDITDYLDVSFDLEDESQKSTVTFRLGGSDKAVLSFNTLAKKEGEYRLRIEQPDKKWEELYDTNKVTGEKTLVGFADPQNGFFWRWEKHELADRNISKEGKLAILLHEKKYLAGEAMLTNPDTIGPISVASDADDGEIYLTAGNYVFASNGESADGTGWNGDGCDNGQDSSITFWRFVLSSEIPSGSTVTDAILELYGIDSFSWDSTNDLRIDATDSGNASAPTAASERPSFCLLSGVPGSTGVTSANVAWNNVTWSTSAYNTSPSIASIIQELVDDNGGLANGAGIVLWVHEPAATGSYVASELNEYASGSNVAKLTITFTSPVPPVSNPHVNIRGSGGGASLSDDFNRADSDSLGANWTEANGDADISSNQLLFPPQGSTHVVAIYSGATTNTVNQYCKITVDITGQNNFYECVFRYIDASSQFYSVGFDTTSNAIQWGRCPDTSASCGTIQESSSVAVDQGDIFGVTLTGAGSSAEVRVWKSPTGNAPDSATSWGGDTSPDLTFTSDPSTPVDIGFLMGLASYTSGANAVTDNFLAGDIPGQGISTNPFVNIRGGAGGSVSYNSSAYGSTSSAGTSISDFTLDLGGSVTNGAVAVGLAFTNNAVSNISVTIGGTPATLVSGTDSTTNGDDYRTMIYGLATGSSSGNQTISVSWTGSSSAAAGAVSASGVDQTTPFQNGTFGVGNTDPASVAITSATGNMTFDFVSLESGNAPTSPTQTSRFAQQSVDFQIGFGGSTASGASSVTHQWTSGVFVDWEQSGLSFKSTSGGGSSGSVKFR